MNIQQYIKTIKESHSLLLEFLDNKGFSNSQRLISLYDQLNIQETKEDLKEFLLFISIISNNHRHTPDFFQKIIEILNNFECSIRRNFKNFEIFEIFQSNKRILLYLFEHEIIIPTKEISDIMLSSKYKKFEYSYYFFNELKDFIHEDQEIDFDYEQKRQIGENEYEVCQIVRKDSVDELISFSKRENLHPSKIKFPLSKYETNSFLNKKGATLIEYTAYFGSINIFKYLINNKVRMSQSLWLYAIYGQNIEILKIMKNSNVMPFETDIKKLYTKSIKSHHVEVAKFICDNFYSDKNEEDFNDFQKFDRFEYSFKYHNYSCFPETLNKLNYFYYLCQYNYIRIVELLLDSDDFNIDINSRVILNNI